MRGRESAMVLILDSIKAQCPKCGHTDFASPALPLPLGSPLTCAQCSAQIFYYELVEQVAVEAGRQK